MPSSENDGNFLRLWPKRARHSSPNHNNNNSSTNAAAAVNPPALALARAPRPSRGGSSQRPARTGTKTIPPPFPWATNRRATVHSHKYLMENKIYAITGRVECKRCKNKFEMVFDLEKKLGELWRVIEREKDTMHDRAPKAWMLPVLPKCRHCGQEDSVQPFLEGTKKRAINWLFLFLGQMLGCCTLKHLKYFLKHNKMHRTGAKDRALYSTYMGLYKQLLPA